MGEKRKCSLFLINMKAVHLPVECAPLGVEKFTHEEFLQAFKRSDDVILLHQVDILLSKADVPNPQAVTPVLQSLLCARVMALDDVKAGWAAVYKHYRLSMRDIIPLEHRPRHLRRNKNIPQVCVEYKDFANLFNLVWKNTGFSYENTVIFITSAMEAFPHGYRLSFIDAAFRYISVKPPGSCCEFVNNKWTQLHLSVLTSCAHKQDKTIKVVEESQYESYVTIEMIEEEERRQAKDGK